MDTEAKTIRVSDSLRRVGAAPIVVYNVCTALERLGENTDFYPVKDFLRLDMVDLSKDPNLGPKSLEAILRVKCVLGETSMAEFAYLAKVNSKLLKVFKDDARVKHYKLTWEQKVSFKSVPMEITSIDRASVRFVWKRLIGHFTRNVVVTCNNLAFDPEKQWPE